MDSRYFLVVGGSSGIGLEIVNALRTQGDEIYVGSRTSAKLAGLERVHHLKLDVKEPPEHLEGLPDVLQGLAGLPAKDSRTSLLYKTHPHPADRLAALGEAVDGRLDAVHGKDLAARFYRIR